MVATYPNLLASGVTSEGTFLPFELFAGESDVVTSQGLCAADILQFQPIARNGDGNIVPWGATAGSANLAGTFSAVGTANDTITINGTVFTLKALAAAVTEVTIGSTAAITATNFAAKVNADSEASGVTASVTGAVVTLYSLQPGVGGNTIAVSESSTAFSWTGGATALAGGTDQTENRAIGIAAQPALSGKYVPYFIGGVFNHEAIVWPAGVDTLFKRQRVFDRTNLTIGKLLGSGSNNITFG